MEIWSEEVTILPDSESEFRYLCVFLGNMGVDSELPG